MQTVSRILIDIDPKADYQPALYRGIELAKKHGAKIELFSSCYNSSFIAACFLDDAHLQQAKNSHIRSQLEKLKKYETEVESAGLEVSVDVAWHHPTYEGIIQKAMASKSDVVMKSTHKHRVISKVFFTPDDWQLLKACEQPLWMAKNKTTMEMRNVLVAIDPTQSHSKPDSLDKKLLETGVAVAKTFNANVLVAHCYEPLGLEMFRELGGFGDIASDHGQYLRATEQHHKKQFDEMTSPYGIEDDNKYLLQGYPEICLPELVEMKDVDLLILGTTYRTGLLGSTAEKLLDEVSCDVLAIKPDGFETPVTPA